MAHGFTRRDALSLTAGALVTAAAATADSMQRAAPKSISELQPLTSRSGVYTPARGEAVMQFSFDFPEPSVPVRDLLFGFRVQTFETVYAIDAEKTKVVREPNAVSIACEGLLGSGGQEKAPGRLAARFEILPDGSIEWTVHVMAPTAVKSITTVVRGLPRGALFIPPRRPRISRMWKKLIACRAGKRATMHPRGCERSISYCRFTARIGPVSYSMTTHGCWRSFAGPRRRSSPARSWCSWLADNISAVIAEFGVDAYFLDIAGAWGNNRQADMYSGTLDLVAAVRARHSGVPPIGEMLYDAQMACIPLSQVTRYAEHLHRGREKPLSSKVMQKKMKIIVRSLSDQTYEVVRRQILLGNMVPGSPVRQDAIATELGVSKIPLREALSRLEHDGLLTSFPNRGYVVRDLSSEEATEVFALRLKLEPDATSVGSKKATPEDHRIAEEALLALEAEMSRPEGDIVTTNHNFHMALIRPGSGHVTYQMIDRLHALAQRYVRVHLQPYGRDARAQQEHRDLLSSWVARKTARVETLAANHIQGTLDDLILQLRN